MRYFFTADTHFMHTNIIKYCDRPFRNADDMDEYLIKRWNEKVDYNDHVYHLGDVGFSNAKKLSDILCRLNGKKFHIRGNHDKAMESEECSHYFEWSKDVYLLTIQDSHALSGCNQMIWLSHYAHLIWPHQHHGAWHLFGHSHGTVKTANKSLDIGVDCWNFAPMSYEELKHVMRSRE